MSARPETNLTEVRSGALSPEPLANGLAERLVEELGAAAAARLLFELGQRLGHGRLGTLRGCARCLRRSVVELPGGAVVCLLCHESGGGRRAGS